MESSEHHPAGGPHHASGEHAASVPTSAVPAYGEDDPVVAQYERWAYPPPVEDFSAPSVAGYLRGFSTLERIAPVYWPAGTPRQDPQDLDVLVAGCGTMAAAAYAYLNPRCRVVGVDFSRTSLAHEQRLKDRHKLDNLTLHLAPVERVGELGLKFDFIACQGVLHHLPDPAAGLRALGGVLRTDGVAAVTLYARYARVGVYMLQDVFRMIGLGQTEEGVAIVRETLATLPAEHPLQPFLRRANDLKDDAGLVDAFLHRRDRPYAVADCLALVREAGLVFQGWDRNFFYYPDGPLAGAPALRRRLEALGEEQVWQAMELVLGVVPMHWFHVCRSDRDPATYRVPWGSAALLDAVVVPAAQLGQVGQVGEVGVGQGRGGQTGWAPVGAGAPPVPVSEAQGAVFSHLDGQRTLRQCLAAAGVKGELAVVEQMGRDFLRLLWRTGFGVIRLPGRR